MVNATQPFARSRLGVVDGTDAGHSLQEEALRRTVLTVLCVCMIAGLKAGQKDPAFEVASVKENKSGQTRYSFSRGLQVNMWGQVIPAPGIATITNAPLREIVARAYFIEPGLERFSLVGGPEQILSRRFDISAQPPTGSPAADRILMLRALLMERFKLKVHSENRMTPAYVLVPARENRLGPALQPSDIDCVEFYKSLGEDPDKREPLNAKGESLCRGNVQQAGSITMRYASRLDFLIRRIQVYFDLPLVDGTGLNGSFEWRLSWGSKDSDGRQLLTVSDALEQQLGLKVERRTAQREVFVIDSVDLPTPN